MNKWILTIIIGIFLTSCYKGNAVAPCRDFGAYCKKIPINVPHGILEGQ